MPPWSTSAIQSPMALSQVQQTVICALGFRLPSITEPLKAPTHSAADTRMNHVGTGGPRALPLPLSFQAGGNGTRWLGSQTAPRAGSRQAGSGRGPCPQTGPCLVGSEALSTPLHLEATGIRPTQASHLWSEEGNRRS